MSTELTPAPEADIRERVAKATEGPWYVVQNDLVGGVAVANVNKPCSEIDYENTSERSLLDLVLYEADARFAAHARDDIPALLAALDAERARAEKAEKSLGDRITTVGPYHEDDSGFGIHWQKDGLCHTLCIKSDGAEYTVFEGHKVVGAQEWKNPRVAALEARVRELEEATNKIMRECDGPHTSAADIARTALEPRK